MFEDFKHLFALIYIIPSLILYFVILYLIFFSTIKNRFSASFYQIFGFSAINYVIHAIVYWLLNRFTATPAFFSFLKTLPKEDFSYLILYFLLFYSGFAVHLYGLMISFNRFTIFLLKTKYKTFWDNYLKYFLAACVLLPAAVLWNFPFTKIQNQPIEGKGANLAATIEFPIWWDKSRNLTLTIAITSSISLFMNLYVIFNLIKLKYYLADQQTTMKITSQDITMAIYSLLLFVTEACSGVVQLLFAIDRETFYVIITKNLWIIADLTSLSPIWFVLITNKIIKEEIKNIFVKKGKTNRSQIMYLS